MGSSEEVEVAHSLVQDAMKDTGGVENDVSIELYEEVAQNATGGLQKDRSINLYEVSDEEVAYSLFQNAMKGDWDEVLTTYTSEETSGKAQRVKITKSEDTALHIAVQDGQTEVVLNMIDILNNAASEILKIRNAKGDTPLHLAAALGDLEMCHEMATKDKQLVSLLNKANETPLFVAAFNGNEDAFLCLHSHCEQDCYTTRSKSGDTILHAAIAGEYFSLAFRIILQHPELVDFMNQDGFSPLHILANTPTAFKSNSRLGPCNRFVYECLNKVQKLKDHKESNKKKDKTFTKNLKDKLCCSLNIRENKNKNAGDAENPQQTTSSEQEETKGEAKDYHMACPFDKKEDTKTLGNKLCCCLNNILTNEGNKNEYAGDPDIQSTISLPGTRQFTKGRVKKSPLNYIYRSFDKISNFMQMIDPYMPFGIVRIMTTYEEIRRHTWANQIMNKLVDESNSYKYTPHQEETDQSRELPDLDTMLTRNELVQEESQPKDELSKKDQKPILIAAKMGMTEMLEKILKEFPVAIRDVDLDNKNVVLLAVEKSKLPTSGKLVYEAKETPILIAATHKDLQEKGNEWMVKTSESCSVVAALIATVAFATSATVPGGLNDKTGQPILSERPAFNAFTISSLLSLCLSVTALVFFLSILTSRYEIHDFSMNLPRKLLLGLTSLFASITSVLVSFCTGHVFLLDAQMRHVAYPLYAATCFPITIFAIAQLPLYYDLIRVIFKKVPQRSYKEYKN